MGEETSPGRVCGQRVYDACMIALTDRQLATVMAGARPVPVEKRNLYLQRVAALLRMRAGYDDGDVTEIARLATAGLIQYRHSAA